MDNATAARHVVLTLTNSETGAQAQTSITVDAGPAGDAAIARAMTYWERAGNFVAASIPESTADAPEVNRAALVATAVEHLLMARTVLDAYRATIAQIPDAVWRSAISDLAALDVVESVGEEGALLVDAAHTMASLIDRAVVVNLGDDQGHLWDGFAEAVTEHLDAAGLRQGPCGTCGERVMGTLACPNIKGECLDCCGCDQVDPEDFAAITEWPITTEHGLTLWKCCAAPDGPACGHRPSHKVD